MWKPVKGFEDTHRISSWGRLERLARIQDWSNRGSRSLHEKIVGGWVDPSTGYLRYALAKDGNSEKRYAHQLVAEAFLDYSDGDLVHHINGNKLDNRACNLQVTNRSEHVRLHFVGENNNNARLNWSKVAEIRRLGARGISQRKIAEQFGVSQSAVGCILRKNTWRI